VHEIEECCDERATWLWRLPCYKTSSLAMDPRAARNKTMRHDIKIGFMTFVSDGGESWRRPGHLAERRSRHLRRERGEFVIAPEAVEAVHSARSSSMRQARQPSPPSHRTCS